MSVRAELVRLGLRWLVKPGNGPAEPIELSRRRLERFARWLPTPRAAIQLARCETGGVAALRVAGPNSRPDHTIFYLHGGGYAAGGPELYRHVLWRLAAAAGASVTAIAYRLAPEHPFPAALDDAVAAWHGLIAEGADPRRTAVIGDSAGGGLALALALRLRDAAAPLPAAVVALSPWTDLALTGASLRRNAAADPMLNAVGASHAAALYLAGADARNCYASPLYGDPAGLPPCLIQVGSDEILRDDAVRMAERMRDAGCAIELEIWRRMPHVWHSFAPVLPEARQAIARIGLYVRQHVDDLSEETSAG